MKPFILGVISLSLYSFGPSASQRDEAAARKPVESFYVAFNEGFTRAADFATEDWAHINPYGGWTRGRDNVLKEVRDVHSTFLKGVTEAIDDVEVRFANREVAVVTVTSKMSTFTTPDGITHQNERHIRTFVVVKRGNRWLVMQDQNTTVSRLR
ncbi:MAG TPA: SgcJ/EcaC family oxidoreductase [Pyrinomonadaceae bacterium]|nr:SgcJ/EcaC family oxidoreductase [Pyrinomonadaceae bacterium]